MKLKIYLFSILFTILFSESKAQVTFEKNTVIDQTFGVDFPLKTVVQDVNNDGLKDLFTTSLNSIVYFKNLGDQKYSKPIELLYSPANYINASELIDIDGDEIKDLVYSYGLNNGNLYWKKGLNSIPQFAEPLLLDDHVFQFKFADIDSDGDLDLFTLRIPTNENIYVGWKENQSNGNFNTFHQVYTSSRYPDQIALGNLNTDSAIDLIQYEKNYNAFGKKMNTGTRFGATTAMDNVAFQTQIKFFIDDVDGDGDNDILFFYDSGNIKRIRWYKNQDAQGNFAAVSTLTTLTNFPSGGNSTTFDFQFADIDGDNLKDLIFSENGMRKIWWRKNLGNLQYGTDIIIDVNQSRLANLMSFDDVDLDNDLDLIVTSSSNDRVAIYANNGNGTFSDPKELSKLSLGSKKLIVADVDKDGQKDLLVANYSDGKLSWFKNKKINSNSDFSDPQRIIKPALSWVSDFSYADLDGDGDQDILYGTNDFGAYVQWLENLGNGNFNTTEKRITYVSGNTTLFALASGDFDGDGDLDVFVQTLNQPVRVFINNGSGTFAEFAQTYNGGLVTGLNPMIDLDADGKKDLYLGKGNIVWYKNTGANNFQLQVNIASDGDYTGQHVLDFDQDGDLDIVYYRTSNNEVGWIENLGNLQFNKHIVSTPISPYDIFPMDVNQNGILDLVWGNKTSLMWQENNGDQNFSNPFKIADDIGFISSITGNDLNGDGIPEIIVSTSSYSDADSRNDLIAVYKINSQLSTEENSTTDNIQIYPNPVSDILKIKSPNKVHSIEIYSLEGKKIKQVLGSQITTSNLIPGNYFIKVTTVKGNSQILKFIKK